MFAAAVTALFLPSFVGGSIPAPIYLFNLLSLLGLVSIFRGTKREAQFSSLSLLFSLTLLAWLILSRGVFELTAPTPNTLVFRARDGADAIFAVMDGEDPMRAPGGPCLPAEVLFGVEWEVAREDRAVSLARSQTGARFGARCWAVRANGVNETRMVLIDTATGDACPLGEGLPLPCPGKILMSKK